MITGGGVGGGLSSYLKRRDGSQGGGGLALNLDTCRIYLAKIYLICIENKMKIGISGARTFENKTKIKSFIFKLKDYADDIIIVGLGERDGADRYIKKYALELDYQYKEANPPHTPCNLYSMMAESFYNKPYSPKNFHVRNKIFVNYVDKCVLFDNTNGTDKTLLKLVSQLNKAYKKPVIIS